MNDKLRDLLGRVCTQLEVRAEFDPTYVGTTKPVNVEGELFNELRQMLDDSAAPWTALAEQKHEDGIRYIGASGHFILGDVFHGYGSLVAGRMAEEGYAARQSVKCWRYSESSEPIPKHLPLTHWQSLPVAPVARPYFEPLKFNDTPDGAAAEAVYLRQVAAEERFHGQ